MNIIELFDKLNIDKEKTIQFSPEEIIRIEKQVNVEKRINPDIDVNVASNLIEALKNYPNEFYFIINNRILYNLFSKKNYSRNHFNNEQKEIDNENIKLFISKFIEEDLVLYIDQKMAQNRFDDLDELLLAKEYLPEDILYSLNKKAIGKIDFAISKIAANTYAETDNINYIKHRSFYEFLSQISSIEIDEKLKSVLNLVVDIYNANNLSVFASTTLVSLCGYKAFDEDFSATLNKNRETVYFNQNRSTTSSGRSSGGETSWKTFAVIAIILIRILLMVSKCSSNNSSSYSPSTYENSNYTVSEESQEELKNIQETVYYQLLIPKFFDYLCNNNNRIPETVKPITNIKTGQTVFSDLFGMTKNYTEIDENKVKIKNNSNYDLVLIVQQVEDKMTKPKYSLFIKKGESLLVNTNKSYFNFYFGDKLASFKTENESGKIRTSDKDYEYRFLSLSENCQDILKDTYQFSNDVTISEKRGKIKITSNDCIVSSPQPVNYKTENETKENVPVVEEVSEEPPTVEEVKNKN